MRTPYEYHDYRLYLRDWFEAQRELDPDFNLRAFAEKAGLATHSFCSAVVSGRRNLTQEATEKFILGLELEQKQAEYFRLLVAFNQEDYAPKKDELFGQLNVLRQHSAYYRLNKDHFAYFSHWSFFVIRELAVLADWGDDYARLGKLVCPAISAAEAKKAVKILTRIGMLIKKGDGRFEQAQEIVSTASIPAHLIRKIRAEFIELSKHASEKLDPDERDLASATVSLTEENYKKSVDILNEARRRIVELTKDKTRAERIYQVNLHVFPVSQIIRQEKRDSYGRG